MFATHSIGDVAGHFLFVSSRSPSRPISSLSMSSFLLGMIISETGSVQEDPSPPLQAHGVCGISTSVAFLRDWLVPRVLETAACKSSSVAFQLLFLRGFDFGQAIGIVISHLLSRWLTLPSCVWYGGLGRLSFRGEGSALYFLALGVHGSFPHFDPGSSFLVLFCVSLRLAWLGVRWVLRLPFTSVDSEVFVGLRFCWSGFWTLGCGSCPWPLWLQL